MLHSQLMPLIQMLRTAVQTHEPEHGHGAWLPLELLPFELLPVEPLPLELLPLEPPQSVLTVWPT